MIPQGGACFWSTWGFLRTKALRAGEDGDRSIDPEINEVTKDVAPLRSSKTPVPKQLSSHRSQKGTRV